jgi:hypothetical protein
VANFFGITLLSKWLNAPSEREVPDLADDGMH